MDRKDITTLVIGKELIQASNIHSKQIQQSVSEFVCNALTLWSDGLMGISTYKNCGNLPEGECFFILVQDDHVIEIGYCRDIKSHIRLLGQGLDGEFDDNLLIIYFREIREPNVLAEWIQQRLSKLGPLISNDCIYSV